MFQRAALLIALVLPCLAASWIIGRLDAGSFTREAARHRDGLERMVGHGARLSQVSSWVEERAGRIRRSIVWGENPGPLLVHDGRKVVRAYLFSRNGRRLVRPGCETDKVRISERCLELIRGIIAGRQGRLSSSDRKLVESFFGVALAADFLARNPGIMIGAEEFHQNCLVGIFGLRTRTQPAESVILLLIVDPTTLAVERLSATAAAKIQEKAGSRYSFGVIDTFGRLPDRPRPLPASWRATLCKDRLSTSFKHGNRLFATRLLDRRFILFGSASLPKPGPEMPFIGLFLFAALMLFATVTMSNRPPLPIRLLVVMLFGLAATAGGALLLGVSAVYRDARQSAMVQERTSRAQELLVNIDSGLNDYLDRLSVRFRRVSAAVGTAWNDWARVERQIETLRPFESVASVMLFDREGRVLKKFGRNITMKRLFQFDEEREMAVVLRQVIRIIEHRSRSSRFPDPPPENTDSYMGWQYAKMFIDHRGMLAPVAFSISAFTFRDIVQAPDGSVRGFLFVLFEQGRIEHAYLSQMRRNLREANATIGFPAKLIALPKAGKEQRVERIGERPAGDLLDLHVLVSQTSSPESRRGVWNGHPMLMTGLPGRLISFHNLLLLTPMRPIEEAMATLYRGFLALAAVFLIYGVGLGMQFASMVLTPVRELSRGLENLAASRFATSIELRTADEFEEIGDGLNETLSEMKELSFARAIQENLFPPGPLETASWSCRGVTRSSSDIGGEIFDHHLVDDGKGGSRGVLWIARLPGHAVGSALVLAMTKMALRLLAAEHDPDPRALLRELANRFPGQADLLRRAALFAGVYEPEEGRMSWAFQGEFAVAPHRADTMFHEDGIHTGMIVLAPGEALAVCSEGSWQAVSGGRDGLARNILPALLANPSRMSDDPFDRIPVSSMGSCTVLLLERRREARA